MSLPPPRTAELRSNIHQQMLVDVGIVLQRAYGTEYAKHFLDEMNIPTPVILRVLEAKKLRPMTHIAPTNG